MQLSELVPDRAVPDVDSDWLYETFADWASSEGLNLYPAQEEALLELVTGANVILNTPTGSGKSLVALGAHFAALNKGVRSYYTAPIKALVSEKFFALCEVFGADKVGMVTGDAAVNPNAPIICATAEILANLALREGADANVGQVIMDEFHYYADPDRGWAWQVPLIELPNAQFLLMSATLGEVDFFAEDLTARTGRETAIVMRLGTPGAAELLVCAHPHHRDARGSGHHQSRAGVRGALHAGGGHGAGAGADEREHVLEGRQGGHRGGDR